MTRMDFTLEICYFYLRIGKAADSRQMKQREVASAGRRREVPSLLASFRQANKAALLKDCSSASGQPIDCSVQ